MSGVVGNHLRLPKIYETVVLYLLVMCSISTHFSAGQVFHNQMYMMFMQSILFYAKETEKKLIQMCLDEDELA